MGKTMTINNHEGNAIEIGYTKKFFPNYLPLRQFLQEQLEQKIDKHSVNYFNAISHYSYSLFENLWLGYLISHSETHKITYQIGNKMLQYSNPFKNNLPSFSMAIMHLGTCRDLLFIFVRIIINSKSLSKNDFSKLSSRKVKYSDVNKFEVDLRKILSQNNESFISLGKEIFNNNLIRNIYAHKIRLAWWENKKCSKTDYFFTKELFNKLSISKDTTEIFSTIENIQEYQNKISNSGCNEIVSATEILKETHDKLANFNNALLGELLTYLKK